MVLPINWPALVGSQPPVLEARDRVEICADLDKLAHDRQGRLQVVPAAAYRERPQMNLTVWCLLRGYYCLPTTELMDALAELLPPARVIEVGAGNGCLGRALGVPCTDDHQQEEPERRAYLAALGQAVVPYGEDVERLTAAHAVAKYSPSVVVAAWVTHVYEPQRHAAGGNVGGIDEVALLGHVNRYVHVGHRRVHQGKAILSRPHREIALPGIVSRALDVEHNVIWVWEGVKQPVHCARCGVRHEHGYGTTCFSNSEPPHEHDWKERR